MPDLRQATIHLAQTVPVMRKHLVPLLRQAAEVDIPLSNRSASEWAEIGSTIRCILWLDQDTLLPNTPSAGDASYESDYQRAQRNQVAEWLGRVQVEGTVVSIAHHNVGLKIKHIEHQGHLPRNNPWPFPRKTLFIDTTGATHPVQGFQCLKITLLT